MEEFNEDYLNSLIQDALKGKGNDQSHPFAVNHLGYGDSDLLSVVAKRLTDYLPESSIDSFMQEMRVDLVSRKSTFTIKDLHTVILNCRKCAISSRPELPKWNSKNPDVAIVIESPSIDSQSIGFLVDKIKNVGFRSDQLCLTYVNRCPKQSKYDNKEIVNCSPYLHSELQLLQPKVIALMGSLVSSVVLGTEVKIKDYRGNLTILGYWTLMPMYSPGYALRSEFMTEQFTSDLVQVYKYINSI
jgi:DNA polymerase